MVEAQKKKSKQCAISIQLHKSKHDKKRRVISCSGMCNKFYEAKEDVEIWYTGRERKEIRKRKGQKAAQDDEE